MPLITELSNYLPTGRQTSHPSKRKKSDWLVFSLRLRVSDRDILAAIAGNLGTSINALIQGIIGHAIAELSNGHTAQGAGEQTQTNVHTSADGNGEGVVNSEAGGGA